MTPRRPDPRTDISMVEWLRRIDGGEVLVGDMDATTFRRLNNGPFGALIDARGHTILRDADPGERPFLTNAGRRMLLMFPHDSAPLPRCHEEREP